MINFIICDDKKEFTVQLTKKIKDFMAKNKKIECSYNVFSGYGKHFEEAVNSPNSFKVYFLDIKTKLNSGLDAARLIREQYDDWNSIIIIITSHEEFKYEALGNRLALFDFINKLNNLDANLNSALTKIVKKYTSNSKAIIVEYDYELHRIQLRDIIYIEKELDGKKCIIVTTYGTYYIQSSLKKLHEKLDERFMKVSRSLIINIKKVRGFNSKTNTVIFINGDESNLVSRECKKELIERVKDHI